MWSVKQKIKNKVSLILKYTSSRLLYRHNTYNTLVCLYLDEKDHLMKFVFLRERQNVWLVDKRNEQWELMLWRQHWQHCHRHHRQQRQQRQQQHSETFACHMVAILGRKVRRVSIKHLKAHSHEVQWVGSCVLEHETCFLIFCATH